MVIKPEDVTIIVPHLGGTPGSEYSIEECIHSLEATAPNIDIIVATNGEKCSGHSFISLSHDIYLKKQGQCAAVNAAAKRVKTPWMMVTNDDMVYPPSWFERLVQGIDGLVCVSPKLVEPRPGAPTFEVFFAGGAGGDFDKIALYNFAINDYYQRFEYKVKPGFNLPFLIYKEVWDVIEGYDEAYDPWGSNGDSDLEYKLRILGVQPYQNDMAFVYHFGQTSGTFHPDYREWWERNWHYFIKKWGFERASANEGIWEATMVIPGRPIRKYEPPWEGLYVPEQP